MKKEIKQENKKAQDRLQKHRVKYQRELTRKPKFKREFSRVAMVIFICIFIVDTVLTMMTGRSYISSVESAVNSDTYAVEDRINVLKDQYSDLDFNQVTVENGNVYAKPGHGEVDIALGQIAYKADIEGENYEYDCMFHSVFEKYRWLKTIKESDASTTRCYISLYNTNGDLLFQQGEHMYQTVIIKDEDKKESHFYLLDKSAMEQNQPGSYKEFFDLIDPTKNGLVMYSAEFQDMYVKGNYVLPKKIILSRMGGFPSELSKSADMIEEDLSGCDFTGYEPLDIGDTSVNVLQPIGINNTNENNYHYKAYKRYSEEEIQKKIKKMSIDKGYQYDTKYTAYTVKGSEWTIDNTESAIIMTTVDYDFFRDWRDILIAFYVLSLLFGLVVSLIIARVRYTRKRTAYEVDSYRRKTTNAMAHDLKSPLMAISGYAENLVKNPGAEKTTYYAQNILDTVKDMDQMIANILQLSKLEEAKVKLKLEEVSLDALLQKQLAKYHDRLDEKQITVKAAGSATVPCDVELMGHLLDNLLSNAVKYSKEESEITIQISDHEVMVSNVMKSDLQVEPDALLEAFVKGDNARNNTEGNGLGLSIVKNIADTLGYQVKLQVEGDVFIVKVMM